MQSLFATQKKTFFFEVRRPAFAALHSLLWLYVHSSGRCCLAIFLFTGSVKVTAQLQVLQRK